MLANCVGSRQFLPPNLTERRRHHSAVTLSSPSSPIFEFQMFTLRINTTFPFTPAIAPFHLWGPALAAVAMEPQAKIPKLDNNNGQITNGKVVLASQALRIKKLSENAVVPSRGSALAAGYDLSSAYDAVVPARGKALVKTDLSIAIPEGTYARVAPRSGLAWKNSIDVGAGVIDADYRGPVGVILFNHADSDYEIKAGDRIAQLILELIVTPDVVEVDDLDATVRGEGGFGSTGVSLVVES